MLGNMRRVNNDLFCHHSQDSCSTLTIYVEFLHTVQDDKMHNWEKISPASFIENLFTL